MTDTDPTQLDDRIGELNARLRELRSAFVELRHQYNSLDVDLLDLDHGPDDSSDAPAALDATQATLGDVTTTLLLAEVGLDLVKPYSTRLKPHTGPGRGVRAA
ncbi:MAG TPA: hypothetical protein VIU87_27160 [Mycobacterium sp.]